MARVSTQAAALIIAQAMADSDLLKTTVGMPDGYQVSYDDVPEADNTKVVGAVVDMISQLRQARGKSGDVTITTKGRVTTIRVGK